MRVLRQMVQKSLQELCEGLGLGFRGRGLGFKLRG